MKKLSIVAVICIIAMLFASCSGNPESKPYAPDWAEGNYTGSVTVPEIGEVTAEAEITSSSFSISVIGIQISSSDEGVSTVKNEYTDTSWTIELSGIPVAGGNNIPVTITKGENGALNVTVDYMNGISGVLTPVTEETPAV